MARELSLHSCKDGADDQNVMNQSNNVQEIGALPRAPKNAPAIRTDTTFCEILLILVESLGPVAGRMPNSTWKYIDFTTPPAIPLQDRIKVSMIRRAEADIRVITKQEDAPVSDESRPCANQR